MQTSNEQNDFCIRFQHRVFKKNNSTSEKGNISEQDLFFFQSPTMHSESL